MERIRIFSVNELQSRLAGFGDNVLFRGQNDHFGSNEHPSFQTSFDRKGCIPSEMMKWCRYADNVLQVHIGPLANTLEFEQALLQHYGWRSFYVDCTSSPAVAAWFASHIYKDHPSLELCEDYEERPVFLRKRMASYEHQDGIGHLYVIDRKLAGELAGVVDLAALSIDGFRVRSRAQDAYLIGSFRNHILPADCFIAHITAERAILRDFAAEAGLAETNDLFPSRDEDPILHALLGLPWKSFAKVPDEPDGIPVFSRALDLPEYHDSFVKIASPRTAFFQNARIADGLDVAGRETVGLSLACRTLPYSERPIPSR